jgi:hypothetical protein
MKRYLLFFAIPVSVVLVLAACLSFIFEPIDGDLTRTGRYSERDFGGKASQPAIQINGNGASIEDPDVLVLGDSFALENVWQSVLARKLDRKILSFDYGQVGCVDNWVKYAMNSSSAKIIVIESVERFFLSHFLEGEKCTSGKQVPFELRASTSEVNRKRWAPELPIRHVFSVAFNTLEMGLTDKTVVSGKVINAPINDVCGIFSNRRADRLLYFADDENKFNWSREDVGRAVSNILAIQRELAERGKKLVFVMVPDKLSVYQDCLLHSDNTGPTTHADITKTLIGSGVNAPNLLTEFRANAGKIVDLYRPNDTHLSTVGYVLLADKLAQYMAGTSSDH